MACVDPEGNLSSVAKKVLELVDEGGGPPQIAEAAGVPLYRVRASLRELVQAGLLVDDGGRLGLTDAGRAAISRSG